MNSPRAHVAEPGTISIYVLHAFQKKTRRTARLDIEIGAKRYRELIRQRRGF